MDADSNPLTTDEAGNTRIQGDAVDMGAYESSFTISHVSIAPDSLNIAEGTNADLTITRNGDTSSALNVTVNITLGSEADATDYNFSGGLNGSLSGTQTVTIPAASASATVNLAALVDAVGAEADETITIDLVDESTYVLDTPSSATATIPANDLSVTNLNDSGEGSLRQAVLNANAFSTDDTITFSTSGTIMLTSGELTVDPNGTLTIEGGGVITVDGNMSDRVFEVTSGANATFDALTITHGRVTGANVGGGILNAGTLTLTNSTVSDSMSADNGAGIYNTGSLTLTDSTVSGNVSQNVAGGILTSGTLIMDGSTISDNSGAGNAGAIYASGGTVTVTDSTLSGNKAPSGNAGGILANSAANVKLINSTISGNSSAYRGGGLLLVNGTMTVINSTISENSSTTGGGIATWASGTMTIDLNNSIVADNTSGGDCVLGAGTINAQNSLIGDNLDCVNGTNSNNLTGDPSLGTLTGSPAYFPLNLNSPAINAGDNALAKDANGNPLTTDEVGNTRVSGGTVDMGAYEAQCPAFPHTVAAGDVNDLIFSITCANNDLSDDVINLTDSTYTLTAINNSEGGSNNGLPAIRDAASVDTLTINGNGATITRDGAAPNFRLFYLELGADLTLDNLTLMNGASASGGSIYIAGSTLTVSDSTLFSNSANTGGAIFINNGIVTLTNSTLSGNSTSDPDSGGGIFINLGYLTLTNSTVAENSAPDTSGGIVLIGGTLTLNNSIVANNDGDCTRGGGTINAQNSLIMDGLTCVNGTNTNNLTGDPSLGALTGSPAYFPLNSDSPAIDAGDNALAVDADSNPLTTDEAGNTRIQGLAVDMGAYEAPPFPDVSISPATLTLAEGTSGDLTITRTINTTDAVDVTVTVMRGGGMTSGDYALSGALSGTPSGTQIITIPANTPSVTVSVAALLDAVGAEADETLSFTLESGSGYTLSTPTSAVVTIAANDLTVTNLANSGTGSLRQAVLNANSFSSDDTITFTISGMITLSSQIDIVNNGSVTIEGGGAIIINGNNHNRVLSLASGAVVTLDQLEIRRGKANSGAAITHRGASLTILRSTISDSAAINGTTGGGIFSNAALLIIDSTISGNSAAGSGGGIYVNKGTTTIVNSTVSNNSASSGGGLYVQSTGSATLNNSIVANSGGGDCSNSGTVTVQNSLIEDSSCGISDGVNGNRIGDPSLGTLTGSPAYYPLNTDSIAINAGDNALALDENGATLSTDEPGNTRIQHGTVDMGAYEISLTAPSIDTQPQDTTIFSGQTADLSVVATGSNLSYQWYQGSSGNTSTPVGTDSASFTTPALTSDTSYWVRVSNGAGSVDSDTATVTVLPAPSIDTQPQDTTILSGQTADLSVVASGSSLSYQWYQGSSGNTTTPVGTDSASFTTPALTSDTSFWVRVSNGAGSVDSDTATVTILLAPSIDTQPQDTTIFSGFTSLLSVGASGSNLSYQWYQGASGNTSTPVGTDSASFTTPALTTDTSYWVRVSNGAGSVDSDTATVTVEGAPSIDTQPQDTTIFSGFTSLLSVGASGSNLSYQWYQGASGDTSTPVGTDSASYTTEVLTSTTSFWVRVSNPGGSVDSDTATVTVESAPTIDTQPQDTTIFSGFTSLLSVGASGSSLSYQWYQGNSGNTSTPVGTDSASYTTEVLTSTTSFWVRVSNPGGSVDSDTATVTVESAPSITTEPQSQTIISGNTATLTVVASGTNLSYQWYQGSSGDIGTPVGSDSASYTTDPLTTDTNYWVRVSNPGGSVDSATATISILSAPQIVTPPQSTTIASGDTATLTVVASGGSLSYQWYQGSTGDTGTPVGSDSASYTTAPLTGDANFWVRVSNPAGSVDSATATITVTPATLPPQWTFVDVKRSGCPAGRTYLTMQLANLVPGHSYYLDATVADSSGNYYMSQHTPVTLSVSGGTNYENLQDVNDLSLSPKLPFPLPQNVPVIVTMTLRDSDGVTQLWQTSINYTCNTGATS